MVNARLVAIASLAAGIAVCTAASARPTIAQIESWIVARPSPQYPAQALARRQAGSGVIKLHFKISTGAVRTAQVAESTGYKTLDAAALNAFRQWRFKAGVLPSIRSLNPNTKEPFAGEDFVAKIPFTFALASGGQVKTGGLGSAH